MWAGIQPPPRAFLIPGTLGQCTLYRTIQGEVFLWQDTRTRSTREVGFGARGHGGNIVSAVQRHAGMSIPWALVCLTRSSDETSFRSASCCRVCPRYDGVLDSTGHRQGQEHHLLKQRGTYHIPSKSCKYTTYLYNCAFERPTNIVAFGRIRIFVLFTT